jgi:hypothetical protein
MNTEEEKRFVLLASVLDLGGRGQKHEVLDNIEAKGYLKLNDHDLKSMPTRNELYWRNDVAYVRKHLVANRYLDGARFNNWEITSKGQSYFHQLSAIVVAQRHFTKLTAAAVGRAAQ